MLNQSLSIEQLCNKLRPLLGKKVDDIYLRYAMSSSLDEKSEIANILNALLLSNLGELLDQRVLLEPPKFESMQGEYPIAKVSYADKEVYDFSLREHDWPRHVCISGMSGSGKTTLALRILDNFIKKDKPFLVFDWKKSFRPLILAGDDVMCFTVGQEKVSNLFKMNINCPPKGVEPKEWINVLCDLLTESFFVSYGVHKVLLETLDEAYEEWGVYKGSENYPTWNHIKWYLEEKLSKTKGREGGWIESALRIASVLTFGNFGTVCNYKESDSLSVEDLLDKKVILELNGLGNIEKKFFCEFVLTYIYKLKKSQEKNAGGRFDHAILVDEAHNIFLKTGTNFSKESVTDMIYREMREYGTSLICLDQHCSKLSDTVKGNSACNIAFQQQLPADIMDVSYLMQLKDQRQYFSMLPVGYAIVKLSERYNSPFLIKTSPLKLREGQVTDNEVRKRAQNMIMNMGFKKGIDPEFNERLIAAEPEFINYHDRVEVVKANKLNKESPYIEKNTEELNYHDRAEVVNVNPIERPSPYEEKKIEAIQPVLQFTAIEPSELQKEDASRQKVKEDSLHNLTKIQSILFEFVEDKLDKGYELKQIENILEQGKDEGNYSLEDIACVINTVLVKRLNSHGVTTLEKQNNYKVEHFNNFNLDREQKMFLRFLEENQEDTGTVNIYRTLGFSSRKGNKIKNELLEKNLIFIQEEKNDKGWKKVIRISPQI